MNNRMVFAAIAVLVPTVKDITGVHSSAFSAQNTSRLVVEELAIPTAPMRLSAQAIFRTHGAQSTKG